MLPDAVLLIGCAEGDRGDDRARLRARVGAYVHRARAEAVDGGVLFDGVDLVCGAGMAVVRSVLSVEADRRHSGYGGSIAGVG